MAYFVTFWHDLSLNLLGSFFKSKPQGLINYTEGLVIKSRLFFSFAFPVFIFGGGGLLKEAYFSSEFYADSQSGLRVFHNSRFIIM